MSPFFLGRYFADAQHKLVGPYFITPVCRICHHM